MTRSIRRAVASAAVVGLVLIGCGDDDDEDATPSDETSEQQDTPSDNGDDVVAMTAKNYEYSGLPDTITAGTKLTLTNASSDEVHEIVALRIPNDEERSVEELTQLPEVELASIFPAGPPAAVIVGPPGEEGTAVVGDGSLREPGRYALFCFIPIGADPVEYMDPANQNEAGPPDVDGGPPHFTSGMFAEVVVE